MRWRLTKPRVGELAPDIVLTDEKGQTWRLGNQRGRFTVLIFHRHIH
jgi:peroxiredoxin